jgi:hypothetical protein
MREIRNDVSHEYSNNIDETIEALNNIFLLKEKLELIYISCLNYLKNNFFTLK